MLLSFLSAMSFCLKAAATLLPCHTCSLFHQLSSRTSISLSSSWLILHGGHRGKQIGRPPAVIKIDIGTTLGPHLSPPKATRIPRPPMPSTRIGTVLQVSRQHRAYLPTLCKPRAIWTVVRSTAKQCSARLHRQPGVLSMVWLVKVWNRSSSSI